MARIDPFESADRTLPKMTSGASVPSQSDIQSVSPALAVHAQAKLWGEVLKRPVLPPRDRSLITVAALISRNQTVEMLHHFKRAFHDGVRPGELSEIIFHLAFYSGWPNAMSAVTVAKSVFDSRFGAKDQR